MKTFGELEPKDYIYLYEKKPRKSTRSITRYDVIEIKQLTEDVIKVSFGEYSDNLPIDYVYFQKTDYKMPYARPNSKNKCILSTMLNEILLNEL